MKGFKPTGFGPSAGFKFPTRMGFTGSTGKFTNVSAYTRVKPIRAFAEGGFVREDTPRMKQETIGDQGSSMVRRKRAYAKWQDDSGAHSPLLPGYKDGGANWIAGATKNKGALHRGLGVPEGKKIPAKKLAKATHSDNPKMRKRAALAKTLGKMHKADGGEVKQHTTNKGFWDSLMDVPEAIKELIRSKGKEAGENSSGIAKQGADKITGRQKQIDSAVDEMSKAKGGKVKRMGYQRGGMAFALQRLRQQQGRAAPPRPVMGIPRLPTVGIAMRSKGGKMKRMGYKDGGGVTATEAQKIAERTVGEHVRYPAPKGHKGFEKLMRR